MKQIIQSLSTGSTELINIPVPSIGSGQLLIRSSCSLISSGTERMLLEFGKSNLITKAKKQPEKVKDVINKTLTDGIISTFDAVKQKLDHPIALGYCNVGTIIEIGDSVNGLEVGDRVVTNCSHSEYAVVNKNLCARIPDSVKDNEAVFTVLSSIGLQGIRLAKPTLGETFVVSGLGLIGLLTAQLLIANGCRVLGIDPDPRKIKVAKSIGVETIEATSISDIVDCCMNLTNDIGADGFIITASTSSNSPIDIASRSCRQRGRIILVGVTGLEFNRDNLYKKELSFQVSCSYGPGRYDNSYEKKGIDYPIGLVRWTEKRNFEAVLSLLEKKLINTSILITHQFDLLDYKEAYNILEGESHYLGIILKYKKGEDKINKTLIIEDKTPLNNLDNYISVVGAGNYSRRILIPALAKTNIKFHTIVSRNGLDTHQIAKKYDFIQSSTDESNLWKNNNSNSIIIATRHDSHASMIIKSLNSGKNVFVEKPLCIKEDEYNSILSTYNNTRNSNGEGPILMVGYNRRFSPLIKLLKEKISFINSPKSFIYTCNSGNIDKNHWTQDPEIGGGRLIGEACHFIDLIKYLAESNIIDLNIMNLNDNKPLSDTFTIQMKFKDGSIGVLNYFSNGNKRFSKERLEIFSSGSIFCLDNFIKLKAWGVQGFKNKILFKQNKGQQECIKEFIDSVSLRKESPIKADDLFEVQRWLLKASKKLT